MKTVIRMATFALATLASNLTSIALASPTAYPTQPGTLQAVHNDTSSTLMGDSQDPTMVWVLPPTAGTVSPANFGGGSANAGFCREMADLQTYSRQLSQRIAQNAIEIASASSDVKAKQAEYYRKLKEAADLAASNQDLQKAVNLGDRVTDLETNIQRLLTQQEQCGVSTAAACQNLDTEIHEQQKERAELRSELTELRAKVRDQYALYMRAKAAADAAKEESDHAVDALMNLNNQVIAARKQLGDMYANFARLEGGFAEILYDTGWDQNLDTLRAANRGYRFEKIQTHNARIDASLVGASDKDSYIASLPAVLDYTVNGKAYLPYGEQGADTIAAMPSRMSATLRLSLVGACPMIHPEQFDLPKSAQGVPLFGVAATFEFPATYYTKVTFNYNLYKVYKKIQETGSSGGLFWSSSYSKVSESLDSTDAFTADWKESDPDNLTSSDDRIRIQNEVKDELMNRVLKQIATPVFDGQAQLAAAPPVPQHGAIVLAQGIQETCGWYSFYCTGGAWLLRGLDSIFGSSSSEQSFEQKYDVSARETWSSETVRWKPGVTVFAGQNALGGSEGALQ